VKNGLEDYVWGSIWLGQEQFSQSHCRLGNTETQAIRQPRKQTRRPEGTLKS
jgi:hypothetical protein